MRCVAYFFAGRVFVVNNMFALSLTISFGCEINNEVKAYRKWATIIPGSGASSSASAHTLIDSQEGAKTLPKLLAVTYVAAATTTTITTEGMSWPQSSEATCIGICIWAKFGQFCGFDMQLFKPKGDEHRRLQVGVKFTQLPH